MKRARNDSMIALYNMIIEFIISHLQSATMTLLARAQKYLYFYVTAQWQSVQKM